MAIQMRRGLVADLDESRLVAGEIVVGLDEDEDFIGVAKAPSNVVQLATKDDFANLYSASFYIQDGDLYATTSGNISFSLTDGNLVVNLS